jgi:hypothetical protein
MGWKSGGKRQFPGPANINGRVGFLSLAARPDSRRTLDDSGRPRLAAGRPRLAAALGERLGRSLLAQLVRRDGTLANVAQLTDRLDRALDECRVLQGP